MFEWIASPEAWVALATLSVLEIILGIDNIIFISILSNRMPPEKRALARTGGLFFAMFTRLGLLFSIAWLASWTQTLFSVADQDISGRDLVLILGGLFLLVKATQEIHSSLEQAQQDETPVNHTKESLMFIWGQIALIDIVFSFDSVITAVGLVDEVSIMALAIIIAILVMMLAAKPISDFIDENPTFKILALAFLVVVGMVLILDGFDINVPKGYIYFAIAFSMGVEMINMRLRPKDAKAIKLHHANEEKLRG